LAVKALPVPRSPVGAAALRARILASARVPYQGYAESVTALGIPRLPGLAGVGALLDGTTDQYAWYRSAAHWRAAVITPAGEDDTYRNGASGYVWAYAQNLLVRIIGSQPARLPRAADLLPPPLARRVLALAGRAGRTTRLPSQRIAGVAAAGLQVRPASPRTTIGAVDVWADPVTGLAVAVEIFARGGGSPVVSSRFLQVAETRPALAAVAPDPAPGVGQATAYLPDVSGILDGIGPALPTSLAGFARVKVPGGLASVAAYGAGFTRFVVIPLPGGLGDDALSASLRAGAGQARLPGGTGALIRTPLVSVVLARPGQAGPVFLLAGTVTPGVLERAAAGLLAVLP
jgi:hypothetical protein